MKKNLYIILMLIISSSFLYSAEPIAKFYLNDGSTKQYILSDIDSMNIIDKKNNFVMRIHYQDTLVAYYPTEIIGSIRFEKDSTTRDILNVYIFSYPKSYILSSIDSVIFYIDQYQPLTIGSQVWMLKNLNVDHYRNGDSIPESRDTIVGRTITYGAWCNYYNNPSLGKIYGKLYNWYAIYDLRVLAPKGWHVAEDSEWSTLTSYLGGESVAGGKLKETGTSHWVKQNSGTTNKSGFSALPGGARDNYGNFSNLHYYSSWWTSGDDVGYTWYRHLSFIDSYIYRRNRDKKVGYSVRCIKDN